MKKVYAVKRINLDFVKTAKDYENEMKHASIHYIKGFAELEKFVGGKLKKQRCGYSGIIGNIEFVAIPCK